MPRLLLTTVLAVALLAVSVHGQGATAGAQAVDGAVAERVDVYESRELSAAVAQAALDAGARAGGSGEVVRGGVLKLQHVWRPSGFVQVPAPQFAYPMATSAMAPATAGGLWGEAAGAVLAAGQLLMGATSAALRGAMTGDVVRLLGWNSVPQDLVIGAVVPDDRIIGEIVMADATADALAFTRPSRVVLWGFTSRDEVQAQLAAGGLDRPGVRIRRSWDLPDPDETSPTAVLKAQLGEFSYRVVRGRVVVDGAWLRAAIPRTRQLLHPGIRVAGRCHRAVMGALRGAFAEVAAAGLAPAINVRNTNRFGGCFSAREIRALGSNSGGFLSRHSWGGAIDMNTLANAMGREPQLDCRVVRIFRKWGFAWGGNFTTPDGMHFEWVGERRDLLPYPSRRCPNEVPIPEGAWPRTPQPNA